MGNRKMIIIALCMIYIIAGLSYAKGNGTNNGKGNGGGGNDDGFYGGNNSGGPQRGNNLQINQGLRHEMRDDQNQMKKNEKIQTLRPEQKKMGDELVNCIHLSQELREKNNEISKALKKSKNTDEIKAKDISALKALIDAIFSNYDELQQIISDNKKSLIIDQTRLIEKIRIKLNETLQAVEKENTKTNKSWETLLSNFDELEKEMNRLERQFRAIDWLLNNE